MSEEVVDFYDSGAEEHRLSQGRARLELERVRTILDVRLPPPPATIVDVGGGPGVHAAWLARRGYSVHLVDPVPLHVEQAREVETPLASVTLGDAASLPFDDASADCVLLFGPLYHLLERDDRIAALAEARRVLRPGGLLAAIAISRYARLLDALAAGRLFREPRRIVTVATSLRTGRVGGPAWYMHLPDDLVDEVHEAGFEVEELLGVEGPGWLLQRFDETWADEERRALLLEVGELVEQERDLVAASTHLFVSARRL